MGIKQISNNVFVDMDLRGSNIGFVNTAEGIVAIDTPQRPTDAVAWHQELAGRAPVRYLIYTEHHVDHTTGGAFLPAIVISHQKNRMALQNRSVTVLQEMVQRADPEGLSLMKDYRPRLPDITFSSSLNLYLGDQTIELLHLPGHIQGGTGVYLPKERVIFTGDVVFNKVKSWIYVDDSEPEKWYGSLELIDKLDVDVIVPGHGDLCDKRQLPVHKRTIEAWVDGVSKAIQQGWSEETAKDKLVCPDPYPMEGKIPSREVARMTKLIDDMAITRLYQLLRPNEATTLG